MKGTVFFQAVVGVVVTTVFFKAGSVSFGHFSIAAVVFSGRAGSGWRYYGHSVLLGGVTRVYYGGSR